MMKDSDNNCIVVGIDNGDGKKQSIMNLPLTLVKSEKTKSL